MEDLLQDYGRDDVKDGAENRERRAQVINSLPGRISVPDLPAIDEQRLRSLPLTTYNTCLLVLMLLALVSLVR